MRSGIVHGRAVLVALISIVMLAAPGAAAGDEPTGLLLTVAARECPSYESITANLARNNIQETLHDLGPDSPYQSGQPIDPVTEADHQPACKPIPGWTFTLGTGIRTQAVTGPWGALSIVTSPFDDGPKTLDSTPLLGTNGQPLSPPQSLAGAATVELTPAQADLAGHPSRLWIQGGTPADPILDQEFPGQFGFGALRCAIDNLNGDNVEWIQFAAGTKHVFCYAYYVRPPPTSGTVIVRKVVTGAPGATQSFTFAGNLSYNTSGTFDLNVVNGQPAQQTFYRAETTSAAPWTVSEQVPPGWKLSDLSCTHGASTVTIDQATAAASIVLAGGDTVVCTYTDALIPPPGQLLINKVTQGGVGTFDFSVTDANDAVLAHASATTTVEGEPAAAQPSPITLDPGTYHVSEQVPKPTDRGTWHATGAFCDGLRQARGSVLVDIAPGQGQVCTFTNTFVPAGAIDIDKVTLGAVGTTNFVIEPVADPATELRQHAVTTAEGVPARATGDSTHGVDLGAYAIVDVPPTTPADGTWILTEVRCDGELVPFAQGRAIVTLTRDDPSSHCVFTNTFDRDLAPTPEDPQPPAPEPEAIPGGTTPDVEVDKRAAAPTTTVGAVVTYRVTVRNHGPATAREVVVDDQPGSGGQLVSARSRAGHCTASGRLAVCRLGNLEPHRSDTVTETMRVTAAGIVGNDAVAGTGTPDRVLVNNIARTRIRARPHRPFQACAAGGPNAHAAC